MPSYSAPIDIFRAAMPMIGGNVPTTHDDHSAQSQVFNATYEGHVEAILSQHSWTFATKRATLAYQGETGDAPAYQYDLPADVLTPRKVLLSKAPFRDFELRGNKLLCDIKDSKEIDLIYTWRAKEPEWPSAFAQGIVYTMAGVLLRALPDRPAQAERMEAKAERAVRHASVIDRRASGRLPFQSDPSLVRAWSGRRRNEERSTYASPTS